MATNRHLSQVSAAAKLPAQISQALLAQQPALQLIYDTAPIGLAFLSPDCRYLQINERLTEICGISVEDHLGRSVRDCVPALAEAVEAIVGSIMKTGEPVLGVEVAGQRADRTEERSWITYWHPLRNPSGEIVGVNVAAEEITERKRAEQLLTKLIDIDRRLIAIFAADIAGYSRLMGADEVNTLRDLTQRRRILDGQIASHRGRIANTAGDSVLAEFGSAVDAVQCAVEAQAALAQANAGLSADRQINFRIGVHVGDVMIKGGDLFGDAVNIAARLQSLASAGGTCISSVAYDQVRKILPLAFTDLGAQQAKNIEEPVRAVAVTVEGAATVAYPAGSLSAPPDNNMPLPLPDKPSIAVLPFENMSGDEEQEYFADGMVEDIITELSRSKSLFVIARNSSFTYKGKAVDIKQVGRELGVRYVLEGSVRKAGNRVRITGQLVDAATGNHIWADRYDSTLEDIFDLQDRVTMSVISAIAPQLERAEIARAQRKPTESLQAFDYYLRALASTNRFTREANIEALKLTQTANDLDPDFAAAFALGANCYVQRWGFGWSSGGADDVSEARRLARRALELDKDDPTVLALAGQALGLFVGEVEEGAALLARAISLDPNLAAARFWNGWVQIFLGDHDAAKEQFQVGLRMSPLDPRIFLAHRGMAYAHFFAGRYEDASSWATIYVQQNPNHLAAHRILMACHAMSGRVEEARQACVRALQLDPTQRISRIKDLGPWRRAEYIERLAQAFLIAGMPE